MKHKKKILGYTLLGVCFIWFFFQLPLNLKKVRPQPLEPSLPAASEIIVAPAVIDAPNDITRIPALQSGVIKHIHVTVGEAVKKGQLLFSQDSTFMENKIEIQKIQLAEAENAMKSRQEHVQFIKQQLERLRQVDKRAISKADLQEKIHQVNMETAQLQQAQYNLALAQANLKNAELTLSQYRVHAPKDGIILQINIHESEFVGASQPIIFLGDAKKVLVRVSLDEREVFHFNPKGKAYITHSNNQEIKIPLTFLRLDQYITTQERLNSRVQEALYYFNRADYPGMVAGQQFDANIYVRNKA